MWWNCITRGRPSGSVMRQTQRKFFAYFRRPWPGDLIRPELWFKVTSHPTGKTGVEIPLNKVIPWDMWKRQWIYPPNLQTGIGVKWMGPADQISSMRSNKSHQDGEHDRWYCLWVYAITHLGQYYIHINKEIIIISKKSYKTTNLPLKVCCWSCMSAEAVRKSVNKRTRIKWLSCAR